MRYEGFVPGQRFVSGWAVLEAAEVRAFASRYDPQPLHLDPAPGGLFGGPIASGYHTLAASWRLWIDCQVFGSDGLAGLGLDEVRWTAPVRPGDRIQTTAAVEACRLSASHPDAGIVQLRLTVCNDQGQTVLSYRTAALVAREALP